ncbi:MAG: hypothetical protein GWO07_11060, partial [Candidatus Dadabacteria bacterium]|nr:hypothetical protein [Candidatus Dadabacteria bacterium]NIV41963.1 hypothetical protein [Candidatus Dadabacteria bacterium]
MINKDFLIRLYVTFFFLGNSPIAPGTAGTLGAILLLLFITNLSLPLYIALIIILTAVSIYMSTLAVNIYKKKDPSHVV